MNGYLSSSPLTGVSAENVKYLIDFLVFQNLHTVQPEVMATHKQHDVRIRQRIRVSKHRHVENG